MNRHAGQLPNTDREDGNILQREPQLERESVKEGKYATCVGSADAKTDHPHYGAQSTTHGERRFSTPPTPSPRSRSALSPSKAKWALYTVNTRRKQVEPGHDRHEPGENLRTQVTCCPKPGKPAERRSSQVHLALSRGARGQTY
jgi:hypothetical protein